MKRLAYLTPALLLAVMWSPTFAGSDVPDLKGAWTIQYQGAQHHKIPEPDRSTHVEVKTGWADVEASVIIDRQEGFRFSGSSASKRKKGRVSGVVGFDNASVYIAGDHGMTLLKLVSPDRMEGVYLHVTNWNSAAGRIIYTRKP